VLWCPASDGALWNLRSNNSAWSARDCSASVYFQQRIWVIGGGTVTGGPSPQKLWYSADGSTFVLVWRQQLVVASSIACYTAPETWISSMDAPWAARQAHSVVVVAPTAGSPPHANSLVLMGGVGTRAQFFNDVWKTDDGLLWTKVTPNAAWCARGGFNALTLEGKVCVVWSVVGWLAGCACFPLTASHEYVCAVQRPDIRYGWCS